METKLRFEGTAVTVVSVPRAWPSPRTTILFQHVTEGGTLIVTVSPEGVFAVQTAEPSGNTRFHQFQRVHIQPQARFVLAIRWSEADVSVFINDLQLEVAPASQQGHCAVPAVHAQHPVADDLQYPGLNPSGAGREIDRFFLETVRDIDAKVTNGTRYDLIRAAGLLRQLLLDGLVHEVNRLYRLKLAFEVLDCWTDPPIEPDPEPLIEPIMDWQALDASPFPGAKVAQVGLDALLAIPVLQAGESTATVRDVIKACANAKGGVHYGPAANTRQELVLAWDERLQIGRIDLSLSFVAGMCRVCLRGVSPIINAILASG